MFQNINRNIFPIWKKILSLEKVLSRKFNSILEICARIVGGDGNIFGISIASVDLNALPTLTRVVLNLDYIILVVRDAHM